MLALGILNRKVDYATIWRRERDSFLVTQESGSPRSRSHEHREAFRAERPSASVMLAGFSPARSARATSGFVATDSNPRYPSGPSRLRKRITRVPRLTFRRFGNAKRDRVVGHSRTSPRRPRPGTGLRFRAAAIRATMPACLIHPGTTATLRENHRRGTPAPPIRCWPS